MSQAHIPQRACMSLLWINGTFVEKTDARVSPFDHGFLYGDGVWEPLRIFRGNLFRPNDHLHNLYEAAASLDLSIPLAPSELLAAIHSTITANQRNEGYVRVIVSRGPGTMGPDPRKIDPQVLILAEEYYPFPLELYSHGLHVVTSPNPLDADDPLHRIRVLGAPHIVRARQHGLRNGCLECLLTNTNGDLLTGTEGNLFVVTEEEIHTPESGFTDPVIHVVRELALESGRSLVSRTTVSVDQLRSAGEAFLAGTSCGIIGIARVDGTDLGTGCEGVVTQQIRFAYHRLTRGGVQ